jgi:hypothetical protein
MEMIKRMAFAPDPGEGLLRREESYTNWIQLTTILSLKMTSNYLAHSEAQVL